MKKPFGNVEIDRLDLFDIHSDRLRAGSAHDPFSGVGNVEMKVVQTFSSRFAVPSFCKTDLLIRQMKRFADDVPRQHFSDQRPAGIFGISVSAHFFAFLQTPWPSFG